MFVFIGGPAHTESFTWPIAEVSSEHIAEIISLELGCYVGF